ncbi:hypothetical protein F511_09094 [Dorcoceras hygrometricum]|nr:hypothetical protein F511_09094 [Dorcoceras hygrometricum]
MTFRVVRTNQYNQDLGLIHSTNGNHMESPNEGSSIDHQVTIYLHAQNITMFPTNETCIILLSSVLLAVPVLLIEEYQDAVFEDERVVLVYLGGERITEVIPVSVFGVVQHGQSAEHFCKFFEVDSISESSPSSSSSEAAEIIYAEVQPTQPDQYIEESLRAPVFR